MLVLAALTHTFAVAMPTMCMPVLFEEISQDLGLDLVQIGAVWGMGALTGIFPSLIGGSLGDRYGTKRTLVLSCLLAGGTGILRGFSTDFTTLSATFLLYGLVSPAISMNVHKVCGLWFSKQRLGLANGVVSAGMALGFAITSMISATLLSPLLGGWRNVVFLYGVVSIGIGIIWTFTQPAPGERRSPTGGENATTIRQVLSRVALNRNVWFLGLVILGIGGCVQGVLGYLSLYLREAGWPAASADGALATFHTMSLFATIPITLLSDRLGSRKTILVIAALMIVTGVGLLSVAKGPAVWFAVIIAGTFRDGFMAIFMTTVIELEGVGAAYAGTAIGLVMVFSGLGKWLAPPLGNSLAGAGSSLPFVLWAAMAAAALLSLHFVKTARRVEQPAESMSNA